MSILSKLGSFLYNHRRKFLITGIIVGSSVATLHYARWKLNEWQQNEIQSILERSRRQRHYEAIESTCNQTIIDLGLMLDKFSHDISNVDELVIAAKSSPSNKVTIWHDLKQAVFTHLCLLIYTQTFLVSILRIQLGIIGGYSYKDAVLKNKNFNINSDLQEKYLSLFSHFLNTGLKDMYQYIKEKVAAVMSSVNLDDSLSIQRVQEIFWAIQAAVSTDDDDNLVRNLCHYIHIDDLIAQTSDKTLKEVYSETVDILHSDEILLVINSSVSCGFVYFLDEILESFPEENKITLVETDTLTVSSKCEAIPTAKLLPIIYNVSCTNIKSGNPSPWLRYLMLMDQLKVLCANIYEAYCC